MRCGCGIGPCLIFGTMLMEMVRDTDANISDNRWTLFGTNCDTELGERKPTAYKALQTKRFYIFPFSYFRFGSVLSVSNETKTISLGLRTKRDKLVGYRIVGYMLLLQRDFETLRCCFFSSFCLLLLFG